MCASEDPAALIIEAWCAPTLVSPAGRPCSVLQLAMRQAAGPVDIGDPYLEDEQWDMEAICDTLARSGTVLAALMLFGSAY